MKPISIKIDTSLPQSVQEGWVKAFQEHCFSKGVTNGNGMFEIVNRDAVFFLTRTHGNHIYFVHHKNAPVTAHEPFTLSTLQDFEAFKSYLDKYIAFYSKPEPKVGAHWKHDSNIILLKREYDWLRADGALFDDLKNEEFERIATPEEITKFKNDQLLAEAEQRYPAGTKFRSALDEDCIAVSGGNFEVTAGGNILVHSTDYTYTVYFQSKDRWAEVIPEKEEKQESERIKELEEALREAQDLNAKLIYKYLNPVESKYSDLGHFKH